jgi:hypothetical protein
VRSGKERWARKKALLFCSSREIGTQDVNVLLLRNVLKKVGQEVEVKLLPRDVSKGVGIVVVIIVVDGDDDVEVCVCVDAVGL